MKYDYLIIGAGIVGAAVAAEIIRRKPNARLMVAEKEPDAAWHQTGRNSGVVHSGVYYQPDSLKARLCRDGIARTKAFCRVNNIAYEERGKLLVATSAQEASRLSLLTKRAQENGVHTELLDEQSLRQLEPAIHGQSALLIPETAITDYTGITKALLGQVESAGGTVRFNAPVTTTIRQGDAYRAMVGDESVSVGQVIACSGLASDRVAHMLGLKLDVRILPFRGEYFVLPRRLNTVVQRLIYPVPDPNLPFLGVHLTPKINNTISVGPNAILAFAREKYDRFSFDLRDAASALAFPGLWRMMARHMGPAIKEVRGSLFKSVYLKAVQKYCPSIRYADLATYYSANRAQAVRRDGTLVDDFLIEQKDGITAVLNAPSPAATSAMPIAEAIADDIL